MSVRRAAVGRAGPAQQRADARRELLWLEGLGDVVVGAGLEPGDDVVGVGASGDHDDRDDALPPQLAAAREAVHARQHDVDDHEVERLRRRAPARTSSSASSPLAGLGDLVALVLEGEAHRGADSLVVFDDAGCDLPWRPSLAALEDRAAVTHRSDDAPFGGYERR